jgi:hypothetical protein
MSKNARYYLRNGPKNRENDQLESPNGKAALLPLRHWIPALKLSCRTLLATATFTLWAGAQGTIKEEE